MKATLITLFTFLSLTTFAQDILGGEMSIKHDSGSAYTINIKIYTQTSMGFSHNSLLVYTGDSQSMQVTGTPTIIGNDVTEWNYSKQHIYAGAGSYVLLTGDSFMVAGIQNMPGSSGDYLYLAERFSINPFSGANSAPVLQNDQTQLFTQNGKIYHYPDALDLEGDSLSFSLDSNLSNAYSYPPGSSIDPLKGLFEMPLLSGRFDIIIKIEEYRKGINIGTTYREMVVDTAYLTNVVDVSPASNRIRIYPNPVETTVTITNASSSEPIVVYDGAGREVLRNASFQHGKVILSMEHLSPGIYFVHAYDGDGRKQVGRILKD